MRSVPKVSHENSEKRALENGSEKTVSKGIRWKPLVLATLQNWADEKCSGNVTLAVNVIVERALKNFEVAPLCPEHNQRMWRGKLGFYCTAKGCSRTQAFRLKS